MKLRSRLSELEIQIKKKLGTVKKLSKEILEVSLENDAYKKVIDDIKVHLKQKNIINYEEFQEIFQTYFS